MKKINRIQLILSITLIIISAAITGVYNYNTYNRLDDHINSLLSQIQKIQEENIINEKQISSLKDELNNFKQYKDLYDELNTENEKLKSDYNILKTSNETLQAQNKELTDKLAQATKTAESNNTNVSSNNVEANSSSGYTSKSGSNDLTNDTVYKTNTGSKYHRSGCRYLRQSKIAITRI